MTVEAEKVYKIPDAAEVKSVSPDVIKRAIKSDDPKHSLAAIRLSTGWRIKASDLDDWFDRLESL